MTASPHLPPAHIIPVIAAARACRTNAHAPYSGFAVGAALLMSDGSIITGTNLENASYGLSLCAESVAIACANAAGKLADIIAIAVVGAPLVAITGFDNEALITPCGRCRQMLVEAAQVAQRSINIYCAQTKGAAWAHYTLDELLPHAFVLKSDTGSAPIGS